MIKPISLLLFIYETLSNVEVVEKSPESSMSSTLIILHEEEKIQH